MKNSFYSNNELKEIGFLSVGVNVLISRKASFYSPELISIGDNVRIDDFCILSGKITIHNFVHISAYCALYGSNGIIIENYCGLSPRCTIFSSIDDFSGDYLIGPMIPSTLTNVQYGLVEIKKFSQIGSNTILFPNITIEEGVAVGAMSLVKTNLMAWSIYAGIPVKKIKDRNKKILDLIKNI